MKAELKLLSGDSCPSRTECWAAHCLRRQGPEEACDQHPSSIPQEAWRLVLGLLIMPAQAKGNKTHAARQQSGSECGTGLTRAINTGVHAAWDWKLLCAGKHILLLTACR